MHDLLHFVYLLPCHVGTLALSSNLISNHTEFNTALLSRDARTIQKHCKHTSKFWIYLLFSFYLAGLDFVRRL
jgi:hypothetical protein